MAITEADFTAAVEKRYKDAHEEIAHQMQKRIELEYWKSASRLNEGYIQDREKNPKAYHGSVWLSFACAVTASDTNGSMAPIDIANFADEMLVKFIDRFDMKTNMLKEV